MFYLVVEMPSEPVIEHPRVHVAGRLKLHGHPVHGLGVPGNVVREMAHLSDPCKPVALKESVKWRIKI